MNLRDKLRAMDSPKKKENAPNERHYTACWEKAETQPLSDFPNAMALCRNTVALMLGATQPPLPEKLDPQKILGAKLRDDIFDSVVAARAAFFTHAQLPRRQTDVIINDYQPLLRIH